MKLVKPFIPLLIAFALIIAAALPLHRAAAQNVPCYMNQGGALAVAASGCEYEFQEGAVVDFQANTRQLVPADTLAITNGTVIQAAYGWQNLSATVESTVTITTTGYVAGDVLRLYNSSSSAVNIADSDPAKASGAVALGQYDTAEFWYSGTYWIQTGESNN